LIACVALFFYGFAETFAFTFDKTTLLFGLLFGCSYCLGYIFEIKALKEGSVSLTSLILAYSLLIPTFFGVFYYHDTIQPTFWAGLGLLVVALFLVNFVPKSKEEKLVEKSEKKSKKKKILWLVFSLLSFTGNGLCTIFSTLQQRQTGGAHRFQFMLYAMALVIVLNLILTLINNKKTKSTLPSLRRGWWCAMGLGVLNGATNFCVMVIVSRNVLNLSLIYSMISAGSLLITFLLARIFFKEKLRLTQLIGFLVGIVSVVLFNV